MGVGKERGARNQWGGTGMGGGTGSGNGQRVAGSRPQIVCVHIPALPLQLLLQRHPTWRDRPTAVVDRDSPQGKLLWVSERARRRRILPGMRWASALALDQELVAGTVSATEIQDTVEDLTERLLHASPDIEPARGEPGVFWLSCRGMERLAPCLESWCGGIEASLERAGFQALGIAAGFTRFGVYAIARVQRGITILESPARERERAHRVPLRRLGIEPDLRDALARLGIDTVGQFLKLPAAGLAERFGQDAYRLHRLALGDDATPLDRATSEEPLARAFDLEQPDGDRNRLLFLIKQLLDPLLAELGTRGEALHALTLELLIETGRRIQETVRPARPTLDGGQLMELLRLRLEGVALPARVDEVRLDVEGATAEEEQLQLFRINPRRDLAAAERALARLRAELGEAAVVRARSADRHLPEGAFLWEPIPHLGLPSPDEAAEPRLIRRILARPRALPPKPHHLRDDGWLIRGAGHGAVTRLIGPYVLAGGWWAGGVERHYHFAETRSGELLWVYFDRARERWFLQGGVE
jgi:protein ImuB